MKSNTFPSRAWQSLQGRFSSRSRRLSGPVGYLFALDDEERAQALKQLPDRARSLQAALAYVAIRPRAAWRTRVLAWKPTLVAAHEQSLFLPDSTAADAVNRVVSGDRAATAAAVGERLTWATTYVDDRGWCERVATDLGLGELAFVTKHVRTGFPVRLRVTGLQLESAALVPLIRKALAFRNTERVTIDLPKGGWVAVAVDKETAFAEVHGEKWVARETIDGSALEALEELGEGLTAVMSRRTSSAA